MRKCDGCENRKNLLHCAWLNPKHSQNGQSAAKPGRQEGSETISEESRHTSDWYAEVVGFQLEEDIVRSHMKV